MLAEAIEHDQLDPGQRRRARRAIPALMTFIKARLKLLDRVNRGAEDPALLWTEANAAVVAEGASFRPWSPGHRAAKLREELGLLEKQVAKK